MAQKWRIKIAAVLGLILAVVQLYGGLWPIATQTLRATHVALGLGMAFMVYPFFKKKDGKPDLLSSKLMFVVDFLLTAGIILCCTYFITQLEALAYRGGNPSTMDIVVSCVAVLLVLEACRRSLGAAMPIIAVIFIVYAMLGNLPGFCGTGQLIWNGSQHIFSSPRKVYLVQLSVPVPQRCFCSSSLAQRWKNRRR